jgi:hypothetical protein
MKKMGFVAALLLAGSLMGACSKKKDTDTPATANPCAAPANPCAAPENPCAAPANPCAAPQ